MRSSEVAVKALRRVGKIKGELEDEVVGTLLAR